LRPENFSVALNFFFDTLLFCGAILQLANSLVGMCAIPLPKDEIAQFVLAICQEAVR
jgi:hypothetical protein